MAGLQTGRAVAASGADARARAGAGSSAAAGADARTTGPVVIRWEGRGRGMDRSSRGPCSGGSGNVSGAQGFCGLEYDTSIL